MKKRTLMAIGVIQRALYSIQRALYSIQRAFPQAEGTREQPVHNNMSILRTMSSETGRSGVILEMQSYSSAAN
jgi:hypothetical protein